MAYLYRTDGTTEQMSPQHGRQFTLKELQQAVGGYIELVMIPGLSKMFFYVNEEGRLQNLPLNQRASLMAGQPLVGNCIMVSSREGGMQ